MQVGLLIGTGSNSRISHSLGRFGLRACVGLVHKMPRKPKNNVDPSTPEEVERSINYKNIEHDEETRSEGKI